MKIKKIYRTIDLARRFGLHPNTIRKYEKIGFISPVPRESNGYRQYSDKHLYQIQICRYIFDYGWIGKDIRAKSMEIIYKMYDWNLEKAKYYAQEYLELINSEWITAKKTAEVLKRWSEKGKKRDLSIGNITYNRKEAAKIIGVTSETLRNWERNELIEVPRIGRNKNRVYGEDEIERLHIIYMLRQSKYSISAIFKSLRQYDIGNTDGVIEALNTPDSLEEVSWICVGDYWIETLENASKGAREIISIIETLTE